jgi:outer membrane protein insertion porin family
LFLVLFTYGFMAMAEPNIKIAVFPFSISSDKPDSKVHNVINKMIIDNLQKEGVIVISPEPQQDIGHWNSDLIKAYGTQTGVNYILKGSVFAAGENISMDLKLINTDAPEQLMPIYTDTDNLEELFLSVVKLSKEIIGKVYQREIIIDIAFEGNKRIGDDAISRVIGTRVGDIFKQEKLSEDLRQIYVMGYFDDIKIEKYPHGNGVQILFKLVEKPSIREIRFKNNRLYEPKELMEVMTIKTGSILNHHNLNDNVEKLRLLYAEKNYHDCSISFEIIPLKHAQADVVFTIKEGEKLYIEKISFEGNVYFSEKQLKKAIETAEKGFFSFFTSSGDLNETEVQNDALRIESLYKNNGFINAKVSDPEIVFEKEYISVHLKIEEGDQYKIDRIKLSGDLIFPKEELMEMLKLKDGELYNREYMQSDMFAISDMYAEKGFANVRIRPAIDKDEKRHLISMKYVIEKGKPVYISRVNISGNLKTRDKVIRREIKVIEQDLYSKDNIEKSYNNLYRLDYFSAINVVPVKTEKKNKMDLNVNVVEKETGQFSFGGGFSSEDGAFGMISVQENNLFGRGQTAKISAKIAKTTALFDIYFHEPYVMDTQVSAGANLYREEKEYQYYDKEAKGFTLMMGYTLFDYTKIGTEYNIENFEITNVQPDYTSMTSGNFLTSNIKPYIVYDSRNHYFIPTEGWRHLFSVEYAGEVIGGDIDYTKYQLESSVWFPLFWKFTGGLHAEGGYIDDRTTDKINMDYMKYYLGGMNSLRGFDTFDIDGTRSGDKQVVGGEKYCQFNAEMTVPLTEKYQLIGVIFYDRGDVYRVSENIDLADQFSSAGLGMRWNSPLGPLRLEYGWVIEGKNVRKTGDGRFAFSIGGFF